MSAPQPVWYVYGVVPTALSVASAPPGLEEAPLRSVEEGPLAALISVLDAERYGPEPLERSTEEVEWLAPRAVAHDRVLTWASDRGAVVPLPMFSLFSGEDAVRGMLRERAAQLQAALRRAGEGREYVLRIYRIDSELEAIACELSPRLAELQRAADAAAPGQRYLLQRKLAGEQKKELRSISERVARDAYAALAPLAVAATEAGGQRRDVSSAGPEGTLVLDAAFLIATAAFEPYQRELTALVERHHARGFRFDFTGPWPPYHFVQNVAEGSTRHA
jgi:hypothetical protein